MQKVTLDKLIEAVHYDFWRNATYQKGGRTVANTIKTSCVRTSTLFIKNEMVALDLLGSVIQQRLPFDAALLNPKGATRLSVLCEVIAGSVAAHFTIKDKRMVAEVAFRERTHS